ncbi:hypothetical protein CH293_11800 [Rhodococcus sp. 14-2470-1b]|uniref:ABC transporter substrate-binding protein n=1 Tax=Rhodococcus sp. 14-2470-1b TaxID=2023149 RepID=UPI000B9ABBA3|nr:ABC transporter substrate-binding protein [Rhodococcus sp. 14-2470-1b]OZF53178.1 hypothetical protein CH293_11800 [Rhodococcus sp. 14-2470-1b]
MKRSVKAALVCAATSVLAIGCSTGSSASEYGTGVDVFAGLTGEPVKVMTIGNWTQPLLGTSNPEFPAGARAAAAAANAAGGLGGRPIEVLVCSDELNPDVARQCAREAVKAKVAAVVGLQTTNETTVLPILESAGIPAVGVYPFTDIGLSSPASFPDVSGFVGQTLGMGVQLAAAGASEVSVVVPGGLGGISGAISSSVEAGAAQANVPFASLVQVPAKSPDLSAVVAAATDDGASVAGFANDEAEFVRSMRMLAPDSHVTTFPFNLTAKVLESVGEDAEGVLSVEGFVPPSADTPGIRQFRADLEAFDPAIPVTATGLHEWLAMWTFVRVAGSLETVSSTSVQDAMNNVRELDMGGITPPYSTTSGSSRYPRLFNPTVVFQTIEDGQTVLQNPADPPFVPIGDLIDAGNG